NLTRAKPKDQRAQPDATTSNNERPAPGGTGLSFPNAGPDSRPEWGIGIRFRTALRRQAILPSLGGLQEGRGAAPLIIERRCSPPLCASRWRCRRIQDQLATRNVIGIATTTRIG